MASTPTLPPASQVAGLARLYGRALRRAATRRQGVLREGAWAPGAELAVEARGVNLGAVQAAAYAEVCGFDAPEAVAPVTLPEVLFLEPLGRLATDARFPVSPFGLIHVGQRIEQTLALPLGAPLDLRCAVAAVREGPRGVELDVALSLARDGAPAWEGLTTLLSRAPGVRGGARAPGVPGGRGGAHAPGVRGGAHAPGVSEPAPPLDDETEGGAVVLAVPGDTGRRYARVSGDWNPHHLWPWSARLLGYRRPIAHGMWTLARALALLPALPAACRVEAAFKRPLSMPGRARFAWEPTAGGGARFEVREPEGGAPHLLGSLAPLGA